jgi:predicted double-glycine peptidase
VGAVLAYWGKDIQTLRNEPRAFFKSNCTAEDLKEIAAEFQMRAFVYKGSISDLETNISKGRPIIALIPSPFYESQPHLSLNGIPVDTIVRMIPSKRRHWVIVVGFVGSKVILHDPARGHMMISRSKYLSWWEKTDYGCLLIVPE